MRGALDAFVRGGACLVLDNPPPFVWDDLPVALTNGKGYTDDERLEITFAFGCAPHHPIVQGLTDGDFSLWGKDHYVARRCFETPQEGNALPLLLAGTDRRGLTCTPLLELPCGRGSWLASTLDLLPKLLDEPRVAAVVHGIAAYRPARPALTVGASVADDTLAVLRQVGFAGPNQETDRALAAEMVLLDGSRLGREAVGRLASVLQSGATVYLHDLGVEKTRAVLAALGLPGRVTDGRTGPREHDTFRHVHQLADGMTHNYLYWIVGKSKLAPWTTASLHPEPASAVVELKDDDKAFSLTRRGAAVVYGTGAGRLVIDNLRWQLGDFDEPERPRRYVMTMLTNLGVPLEQGAAKRTGGDYETDAERRERGHF